MLLASELVITRKKPCFHIAIYGKVVLIFAASQGDPRIPPRNRAAARVPSPAPHSVGLATRALAHGLRTSRPFLLRLEQQTWIDRHCVCSARRGGVVLLTQSRSGVV